MSADTSTADAPPRWALGLNLAQPRLGAEVVYATDDFFAAKERLIQASAPVWREGEYDDNGKWMDGWESRRRRDDGHDHCVVRLGLRAVVDGFEIDTTYFDGNHPEAASIDVADGDEAPSDEDGWREVVPRTRGDLRVAITGRRMAFGPEHSVLAEAERVAEEIDSLHTEMSADAN